MKVVDCDTQTDTDRKSLSESVFGYLNRSARRGSAAVRTLMEEWLVKVPISEQGEFCSRLRSCDDTQFVTAFHELFLHEFLRRQMCVLEFHPRIPGSSKRPDFRVCPPYGHEFILEARVATHVASGPKSNPRGDRIREFLRQMELDGCRLGIDELTVGTKDVQQKALRKHIVDAIAAHSDKADSSSRIPEYTTMDGWCIRLTAFSSRRYGNGGSSTVMQEAWGGTWSGPSYPLRDALRKKAGKYGPLGMPYVIAINSADVMLTDRDFDETLFGVRPCIAIAGMTDKFARGFWGTEHAPDHRRVSAVLFTKNLWPATVLMGQVYACLYINPWAERPYEGLLAQLPTFRFENGESREYPGKTWHELMSLKPLIDKSLWD